MISASRTVAPALLCSARKKISRIGTPVSDAPISAKSPTIEKKMPTEKNQLVTNPIPTVPIMAIGTIFSGRCTSSARCVAQSRQAKAQFVFTRPTMKAIPSCCQPVLLIKVAKTKRACWCVGATAGTVMSITAKESSEIHSVVFPTVGSILP